MNYYQHIIAILISYIILYIAQYYYYVYNSH